MATFPGFPADWPRVELKPPASPDFNSTMHQVCVVVSQTVFFRDFKNPTKGVWTLKLRNLDHANRVLARSEPLLVKPRPLSQTDPWTREAANELDSKTCTAALVILADPKQKRLLKVPRDWRKHWPSAADLCFAVREFSSIEESQKVITLALTQACANCQAAKAKKCRGCMRVRYCSMRCQKEHWDVHKTTCGK